MNVSELNFKDEEEQMSDAPSINVEEAMQQFTYHYVPKKTEAMIKLENAVLGIKEEKKNAGPLVIEIDEDELLESTNRPLESRPDSRMKRTKRIKDSSKEKRGNLRIDPDDNFSDLIPAEDKPKEKERISERISEKINEPIIENISDKISEKSEKISEESNYWTRKRKAQ
jgi:hypothetical protein